MGYSSEKYRSSRKRSNGNDRSGGKYIEIENNEGRRRLNTREDRSSSSREDRRCSRGERSSSSHPRRSRSRKERSSSLRKRSSSRQKRSSSRRKRSSSRRKRSSPKRKRSSSKRERSSSRKERSSPRRERSSPGRERSSSRRKRDTSTTVRSSSRRDKSTDRFYSSRERERYRSRSRDADRKGRWKPSSDRSSRGKSSGRNREIYKYDSPPRGVSNFSAVFSSGFFGSLCNSQKVPNQELVEEKEEIDIHSVVLPEEVGLEGPQDLELLSKFSPDQIKWAKQVYIYSMPDDVDLKQIPIYIDSLMNLLNPKYSSEKTENDDMDTEEESTICSAESRDGYICIEFPDMKHASNAIVLNGLNCLGQILRVTRPPELPRELWVALPRRNVPAIPSSSLSNGASGINCFMLGITSRSKKNRAQPDKIQKSPNGTPVDPIAALAAAQTAASAVAAGVPVNQFLNSVRVPDRLCIMDIPVALTEEKVRELVTTFGNVKYFKLLKKLSGESAGICLVDFEDYESQVQAVDILTGNTPYKVVLAEDAAAQGLLTEFLKNPRYRNGELEDEKYTGGFTTKCVYMRPQVPTNCIMISNILKPSALMDEKEYLSIKQDIRSECSNYGTVEEIEIPRPVRGFENDPAFVDISVGYVFVHYDSVYAAAKARSLLSGRKYDNSRIEVSYFNPKLFANRNFSNPQPNFEPFETPAYF